MIAQELDQKRFYLLFLWIGHPPFTSPKINWQAGGNISLLATKNLTELFFEIVKKKKPEGYEIKVSTIALINKSSHR